jgi:hypothetical protein
MCVQNQISGLSTSKMSRKRSSRNKNPVSPFDRIVTCCGLEFVQKTFEDELDKAAVFETVIPFSRFKKVECQELQPTSTSSSEVITVKCKVKAGESINQYPSVKVRLSSKERMGKLCSVYGPDQKSFNQDSVPLDLHRLSALSNLNWNTNSIKNGDHAIHRCHNKGCFNPEHLYFGNHDTNQSTEFCPVWILVNGVLVNCCHHDPVCLIPGNRVPTTI